jgi:enoyl-CoA hydratase/carnithine racemase
MTATMNEKAAATLVTYRKEGNIAVFELNDPPANTYTHEMMRQLDECIIKARFDNDVQVIILRGAGEKFFSAGANINMLNTVDPVFKYYFCLHANETLSRLEQTRSRWPRTSASRARTRARSDSPK